MWSRTHAPKPLIDTEKLKFCLKNNLNVLLTGGHGVGKTTVVQRVFEEAGLKLLILSGATMDPWVDFVGVPRPVTRPDGSTVLDLVRRPELADDAVDAIFIDEFNRAPAKVRNAALELLQFKSVNGHRFDRLKTVWAAINPEDNANYDTERLDDAQRDRFHVQIEIPYRPCPAYFINKFGSKGKAALEWWDTLGEEARRKISPRRLDYAIQVVELGGPVRDVLPKEASVQALLQMLEEGPVFDKLKQFLQTEDRAGAKALLDDPSTGSQALRHIIGSKAAALFFLPLVDRERLMSVLPNPVVLDTVIKYSNNVPEFQTALQALYLIEGSKELRKRATHVCQKHSIAIPGSGQPSLVTHISPIDPKVIQELDPYGRLAG